MKNSFLLTSILLTGISSYTASTNAQTGASTITVTTNMTLTLPSGATFNTAGYPGQSSFLGSLSAGGGFSNIASLSKLSYSTTTNAVSASVPSNIGRILIVFQDNGGNLWQWTGTAQSGSVQVTYATSQYVSQKAPNAMLFTLPSGMTITGAWASSSNAATKSPSQSGLPALSLGTASGYMQIQSSLNFTASSVTTLGTITTPTSIVVQISGSNFSYCWVGLWAGGSIVNLADLTSQQLASTCVYMNNYIKLTANAGVLNFIQTYKNWVVVQGVNASTSYIKP